MLKTLITFILLTFLNTALYSQNVSINFTVVNQSNEFYSELKETDIQFKMGKEILQIKSFEKIENVPLEIVLMIDASVSQERVLPLEKQAAKKFIDEFLRGKRDKVAIVKFTGKLVLEQDMTDNFELAKSKIDGIEIEVPNNISFRTSNSNATDAGATSIWSSLTQVMTALEKSPQSLSRKSILLISDGVNTYGKAKLKEVINKSSKLKMPVFVIGIGDKEFFGVDKKSIKKLTSATAGTFAIIEKESDLTKISSLKNALLNFYRVNLEKISKRTSKKGRDFNILITSPKLRNLKIIKPKKIF